MLITESQLNINRSIDSINLLNNIGYLTESEATYNPIMVPVVENNELGSHLIQIEDMMSFAEANGIEDLGYALSLVCEASSIDPSTVAFSVHEHNLIANDEIASLVSGILNEGVSVVAKPLSENDSASVLGNFAVNYLLETGDDIALQMYCEAPEALALEYCLALNEAMSLDELKSQFQQLGYSPQKVQNIWFNKLKEKKAKANKEYKEKNNGNDMPTNEINAISLSNKDIEDIRSSISTTMGKKYKQGQEQIDTKNAAKAKYAKLQQQKRQGVTTRVGGVTTGSDGSTRTGYANKSQMATVQYDKNAKSGFKGALGDDNAAQDAAKATAQQAEEAPKTNAPAADTGNSNIPNTPEKAESFLDKIKRNANKGRDWIAKQIAKLHAWASRINYQIKNDPSKTGIWNTIKQKITAAIQWLTAKMHNVIAANRADLASSAKQYNDSKYTLD